MSQEIELCNTKVNFREPICEEWMMALIVFLGVR
jgi:hypothetical protein